MTGALHSARISTVEVNFAANKHELNNITARRSVISVVFALQIRWLQKPLKDLRRVPLGKPMISN